MTSGWLAALSVVVAIGAPVAYALSRDYQVRPDPGDVLRAVGAL